MFGDFFKGNTFRALSVIDDPDDKVSYDGHPLNKPKQPFSSSAYNQQQFKFKCNR